MAGIFCSTVLGMFQVFAIAQFERYMCMRRLIPVVFVLAISAIAAAVPNADPAAKSDPLSITVTTSSPEARKLFDKGFAEYENIQFSKALSAWRAATLADPSFALAHLYISVATNSPIEEASEREAAKSLAAKATPDEQLLIKWLASAEEADYVSAIPAMNELLDKHPGDKHLLLEAVGFFNRQGVPEKVIERANQALAIDGSFVPVLNQLAYNFAWQRQFDKATEALEKCIALQPGEPNPQDSLGEILRMAGKFDGSVKHYEAALKIDPKFDSAQVGLGDTYMLMGKYDQARQSYGDAAKLVIDDATLLKYAAQSAQTYVREKNLGEADKAFSAIQDRAHKLGFGAIEAEMLRAIALYHKEDAVTFILLDQAQAELLAHPAAASVTDLEHALLFRDRVVRSAASGNKKVMAAAGNALAELKQIADKDRRASVQRAFHTANGAMLLAEKKYAEAVAELKEDDLNPTALSLLVTAQDKAGNKSEAEAARQKLASTHLPSIEEAVILGN